MPNPSLPFEFIAEFLNGPAISIKPMFGMKAVYQEDKILLILRSVTKKPEANGIWVAVAKGYKEALLQDIPALRHVEGLKKEDKGSLWLLLPADSDRFETDASEICRLIKKGDVRIGRVPKKTGRKSKANK